MSVYTDVFKIPYGATHENQSTSAGAGTSCQCLAWTVYKHCNNLPRLPFAL